MPDLPTFMAGVKPTDDSVFKMPAYHEEPDGDEEEDECDCLVEVPDIRQPDNYSCGAACAMSVGKYYGVGPDTIGEWKKLLGTNVAKSTAPDMIYKVLTNLGLQCIAARDMTVEDLCYYHKLGVPVICPIQEWGDPRVKASSKYGHYVVVVGVGYGYVFVQDPSIDNVLDGEGADNSKGKMMICECEWCKDWHDEGVDEEPLHHYGIAVFCHDETDGPPSEMDGI
jgi:hypothetical protein